MHIDKIAVWVTGSKVMYISISDELLICCNLTASSLSRQRGVGKPYGHPLSQLFISVICVINACTHLQLCYLFLMIHSITLDQIIFVFSTLIWEKFSIVIISYPKFTYEVLVYLPLYYIT